MEFDTTTQEFVCDQDDVELLGLPSDTNRLPATEALNLDLLLQRAREKTSAIDLSQTYRGADFNVAQALKVRRERAAISIDGCLRGQLEAQYLSS